jgi:hypothetical protein
MSYALASWLSSFESFYRRIGLLGGGFKFVQDDRRRLAESDWPALQGRLRSRWLYEGCTQDNEAELLASVHGSHALMWLCEDIDCAEWVRALTTVSRGSFMPVDLRRQWHGDDFLELRCSWGGRACRLFHPRTKNLRRSVLHEVNRWIAHTGRQFAEIGWGPDGDPIFACVNEAELEALHERGLEPRVPQGWVDTEPRELIPLAEQLLRGRDYETLLAATSFNEALLQQEPALHFYRGAALFGLSRNDEGYKHLGIAEARGMVNALARAKALRIGNLAPTPDAATAFATPRRPMSEEEWDLLFFGEYALNVSVVTIPTLRAWRDKASELGLTVRFPGTLDIKTHDGPLEVSVEFAPSAPLEAAQRLAKRGRMIATFAFGAEPSGPYDFNALKDIFYASEEHELLERTTYGISLGGPRTPDLVPTLLAISLAAAGEGVVYHCGLDASACGTDAMAMWKELKLMNDEVDED